MEQKKENISSLTRGETLLANNWQREKIKREENESEDVELLLKEIPELDISDKIESFLEDAKAAIIIYSTNRSPEFINTIGRIISHIENKKSHNEKFSNQIVQYVFFDIPASFAFYEREGDKYIYSFREILLSIVQDESNNEFVKSFAAKYATNVLDCYNCAVAGFESATDEDKSRNQVSLKLMNSKNSHDIKCFDKALSKVVIKEINNDESKQKIENIVSNRLEQGNNEMYDTLRHKIPALNQKYRRDNNNADHGLHPISKMLQNFVTRRLREISNLENNDSSDEEKDLVCTKTTFSTRPSNPSGSSLIAPQQTNEQFQH